MSAVEKRSAPRNPARLPNRTPPGHGGYRNPTHVDPRGAPKDAGKAAPGNGTNKPAKTPARPNPGKPMVRQPVGDPKKRMGAIKKLVKKNLKRLAVKGGAKLLGALGGPLGMAAVTCADIGFDLAYLAGSALGRRNHPTTPADPGGNKILKKQSDGTYKWVPGPKTPPKTKTPPEPKIAPITNDGKIPPRPAPTVKPNDNKIPSPKPNGGAPNVESTPKPSGGQNTGNAKPSGGQPDTHVNGGNAAEVMFDDRISAERREQIEQEHKRRNDEDNRVLREKSQKYADYDSALKTQLEARRRWKKGDGPYPELPNPSDFGV
jgi:hypothetical protein